jgi:transcriptional regulator with XRE-family HTH domain
MIERPGVAAMLAELRRELKRQDIRIGALAERLAVAEPTVWRWLRGEGLSLARLDQICAVAGLELRDLVGRSHGPEQEAFTLAQERILAADRGLALAFFAILHGAQRRELEDQFGLTGNRLDQHLARLHRMDLVDMAPSGRLRARTRKAVRWRPGGPMSIAFEKTVKRFFIAMDFGAEESRYVSDMVRLSMAGRARVQALFEALREDIQLVCQQDQAAHMESYDWSAVLMLIRPLDLDAMTSEWRDRDNPETEQAGETPT